MFVGLSKSACRCHFWVETFWGGFENFSKLHEFLTSPFKIFGLQSHVYSLSSVVNDWKFLRNVFLSCLTDDNRRRARKSARAHIYVAAATEIKVCDSSCASWGSCGASARQRRIFTRKIRAKMATTCWFPRAPSDGTFFCQKTDVDGFLCMIGNPELRTFWGDSFLWQSNRTQLSRSYLQSFLNAW